MKPVKIPLLAALLTTAACQPSSPPAALASAPPPADLTCPAEPDVVAMLAADPSGVTFDAAVRSAGQQCRDALRRVCMWHRERGLKIDCDKPLEIQP